MRFNSVILIGAILVAANAGAADFGGITLGAIAKAETLANLGISAGAGAVMPGRYSGEHRFELVDTKTAVEIDAAGSVTQIYANFHTLQVESIRDMALRKWGKPIDSGTAVMPNGHLEQIWIWNTKDGAEVTLLSYDPAIETGTLTRGSLTMITKAAADAKRGQKGNSL